jgi:hypothetical protein
MNCFVQWRIAAAVLGLATAFEVAQAAADEQGRAAVMTSGNGTAVSGVWDGQGFHGVYSGPTGVGRVNQPGNRKKPVVKPARSAVIQPGSMIVVGDGDAAAGVSIGGPVGAFAGTGAFAGAGAGGAVAISGPEGVAVGIPGAPMMIVGGNVPLLQDARKPLHPRRYRTVKPEQPENPVGAPESGKRMPNAVRSFQRTAPLPPMLPAPPRPDGPDRLNSQDK